MGEYPEVNPILLERRYEARVFSGERELGFSAPRPTSRGAPSGSEEGTDMHREVRTANTDWKQLLGAAVLGLAIAAWFGVDRAAAQSAPDSTAQPAATPEATPAAAATTTEPAPAARRQRPIRRRPWRPAAPAGTAAAPAATAAAADDTTDADGGWPRLIVAPSGASIILYQPQLMSWKDQRYLTAMAAVSYMPKGASKPDLGTIRLESPTSTSVEDRMVNFQKVSLTSMNFPSLEKAETQEVLAEIQKSLPKENVLISLDRILAMADTSQINARNVSINTEPPPIFYSEKPAILIQTDGEPILAAVDGTYLKFAVNTNWDLFQHERRRSITYVTRTTGSSDLIWARGCPWTSCPRTSRSSRPTTTGRM